ncbi:copper chaperone PCu(A)C [Alkalimonas sp. MEB108]|uniref:Copper chaperone PCu(A)C n=1 Tax=Alkalimonas cellulosilytica TaxID=3058395 RepID=A0ABU7J574_9GAMM|nr:copper chaperone PCu(A)C [Alkalimonas sp. MEB108]MEE2001130.1 copper chaperone PCu(A)C [Alkalimonas sp. MEB108]
MKALSLLLLGSALFFLQPAAAVPAATIEADEVIVRVPMPGRTVTAGYLTLHNHSEQARQLIAVQSDAFARVELHTHTHVDGMMRMVQVDAIDIPAAGKVSLQPGGLHLMLFEPQQALEEHQSVPLHLQFDDGSHMQLDARLVMPPRR